MLMRTKIKCELFFWIIVLLVIVSRGLVAEEIVTVTIPEQVEITGSRILLTEIAEIEGGDENLWQTMQTTDLAVAPRLGFYHRLSRDLIVRAIQNQNDLPPIELQMGEWVLVGIKTQKIDYQEILDFVEEWLAVNTDYSREKIKVKLNYHPGEIVLPQKDYHLEIESLDINHLPGFVSVVVLINIDEWSPKRIFLGLEIALNTDVYRAQRTIIRGSKLNRDDFVKENIELNFKLNGQIITDWEDPLIQQGMVKIPLGEGNILTDYYLEKNNNDRRNQQSDEREPTATGNNLAVISNDYNEPLVRWGDRVTVQISINNLQVATTVRVREAGHKGELVTVENESTGYQFKARIISSELVTVDL